ncbi:MAG: hypothetical protein OEX08_02310 [Candidatus Nomurabacteria bacterium]|nr:hypothetical protein [Candidatus Nomurabacteria bacterium]
MIIVFIATFLFPALAQQDDRIRAVAEIIPYYMDGSDMEIYFMVESKIKKIKFLEIELEEIHKNKVQDFGNSQETKDKISQALGVEYKVLKLDSCEKYTLEDAGSIYLFYFVKLYGDQKKDMPRNRVSFFHHEYIYRWFAPIESTTLRWYMGGR